MMARTIFGQASRRAAAPIVRWAGATIIAGIFLAALGPFGSYLNGGPVQRACYWVAAMLLGLVLYGAAVKVATTLAPTRTRLRWIVLVGATLVASVPEALATRTGAFWLWPDLAHLPLSLPLWFAQTTTIGLIAVLGAAFVLHRSAPMSAVEDEPVRSGFPPAGTAPLADDVLALQMEDHYVRLHRPNGSELILMPLGRAIDGVKVEGLQTHRSWWVARHAVDSVEGTPRSMRLRLSNGVVAPVARSAVIHLKAAGWITTHEGNVGFRVERKEPRSG
jgi:hypothetical protein